LCSIQMNRKMVNELHVLEILASQLHLKTFLVF
jgi:hypothetical protein